MKQTTVAVVITAIACLGVGFFFGFVSGIYTTELGKDFLEGMVAVEKPADIESPKQVVRDQFLFKYASNWEIDDQAEYFDMDSYFLIDTPGGSYIEFDITPGELSAKDQVRETVEYFEQLFEVSKRIEFDRWGSYEGHGVHLYGNLFGEEVQTRTFCYATENVTFTITEFFDTATIDMVSPGYDLIESSFEVLDAPEDMIE